MKRILSACFFCLFFGWMTASAAGGPAHYYISSEKGSDGNDGLSPAKCWKTLVPLRDRLFKPGDSILFERNSSFRGGLLVSSSGDSLAPIVFGSHGEGKQPVFTNPDYADLYGNVIRIRGSHICIDGLHFTGTANYTGHAVDSAGKRGQDRRILSIGAVYQETGASHLTVKNSEFNDCPIALYVNGQFNRITHNYFHDCNRFLWEPDWGPIAVVIGNAFNEISYNKCANYLKEGGNFGADGGFIELDSRYYGGPIHDLSIHHNYSWGNEGFMEVTNAGKNLDVSYNVSDDFQQFIFYWSGDSSRIEHNTVIRTRPANAKVNVVLTFRKKGFIFRNNIFVIADSLKVFGSGAYDAWSFDQLHEYNLYFSMDGSSPDPVGKPLGKGELVADPLFVDFANKDYRLKKDSPARGKGSDGADLGALQYQ